MKWNAFQFLHREPSGIDRVGTVSSGPLKAFTLAEVLITLAIIGIVAALTIPTVVHNYQKTQLKTALKKNWSIMTQLLNQTAFEFGEKPLCYYDYSTGTYINTDCTQFKENFTNKLKTIKTCTSDAINKGCQPKYDTYGTCLMYTQDNMPNQTTYVLADGTIIINGGAAPRFAIDINGTKGPNKIGRDLFEFSFRYDGKKFFFYNIITDYFPSELNTGRVPGDSIYSYYSKLDKW